MKIISYSVILLALIWGRPVTLSQETVWVQTNILKLGSKLSSIKQDKKLIFCDNESNLIDYSITGRRFPLQESGQRTSKLE